MIQRRDNFFDPDVLHFEEKQYYDKMKPIINKILTDLRYQCLLEQKEIIETAQVIAIIQNKEQISKTFNIINNIFEDENSANDFIEKTKDYLTNERLFYLYFSQLVLLFLNYTELFKDFLIFYLRCSGDLPFKEKMTLSPFLDALERVSPYGKYLKNEFNVMLRNALSHGLYHLEKIEGSPKIYYYSSLKKLDKPKVISLAEFHVLMKKINLLFLILTESFQEVRTKK
jgi:hypothetical protein